MHKLGNRPSAPSKTFRRLYFSRKASSRIRTHDLPLERNANLYHPWALLWGSMFLIVPFCYLYILWIVIRELCLYFPETLLDPLIAYFPGVAMGIAECSASRWLEAWCILEAVFYIVLKVRIWWLQSMTCPLEASLSIAPLMDEDEREGLFHAMMNADVGMNIEQWLCGWFFDSPLEGISKYDVRDFVTWSMFEGRRLEHLTPEESAQLERFVQELEYRISIELYGIQGEENDEDDQKTGNETKDNNKASEQDQDKEDGAGRSIIDEAAAEAAEETVGSKTKTKPTTFGEKKRRGFAKNRKGQESFANDIQQQLAGLFKERPKPKREFTFPENDMASEEPSTFFSNLYESYRRKCEQYADFDPLQEFRNVLVWSTAEESALLELLRKRAGESSALTELSKKAGESAMALKTCAEESAMALKTRAEESALAFKTRAEESAKKVRSMLAETAQHTAQQLEKAEESAKAAADHVYQALVETGSSVDKQLAATHHQLVQAWNGTVKERLEMAKFVNRQRRRLEAKLHSSRVLWKKMRSMASHVPSHQKAVLLRQITATHEALERLEGRTRDRLVRATGFARQRLQALFPQQEPPKPFAKYSSDPLLGIATYPLGLHLLALGGTEVPLRVMMHQRGFQRFTVGRISYYYHPGNLEEEDDYDDDVNPTVFIHGIGIGLLCYIPLVDELRKRSNRPIFLPEIPYVTAFRPWQTTSAVLPPDVVCSSLTAMLALHGYSKAVFCGHSFGTSWLAYMVKYARSAVAAVLFLDPICFALHVAVLTKQWVYVRPDPGTIAYIVRTDLMVNLCIQRAFPWAWVILFVEQLQGLPWAIFVSSEDTLAPAQRVEHYLRSNGCNVMDFDRAEFHMQQDKTVCVFRGEPHGGWVERPSATCPQIAECAQVLHDQAKQQQQTEQ